jgi:VTC domain
LKQLIKDRTSGKGTTDPVSIPGQGSADAAWAQLERELFSILCEQHERVNLFTRSKHGEFERRMDYIDRQVRLLTRKKNERSSQPVQNTQRYAKLVQEADGVGEDVQSLCRYVATQKQAFRKILKKYRKWTGSSSLELRMNNETFSQPGSVLNWDFMPLLDRLAGVKSSLEALSKSCANVEDRSGQDHRKSSAIVSQKPKSIASRLHDEFLHSSALKFDAAFTAVPLGMAGGRASYWIHKDNLEEVSVLLRRYMKDRKGLTSPPVSKNTSVTFLPAARRDSEQSAMLECRTHISMFDNLHRFIKAHGAVTVGQAEDLVGSVSSKVAMSIIWANEPEAIVITSDLSPSAAPTQRHLDVVPMKSKHLVKLFEPEARPPSRFSRGSANKSAASDASVQAHRDWLVQNRDIKPLAEVSCTRSRFAGLNNTSEVGTWALMDMDITMSSIDTLTIGNSSCGDVVDVQGFPHTVLEVRWEFSRTPEIVRALDSTHLVERIRGFSIEAQAISTICKPSDMPSPMWQPLLERDIRKVPPLQIRTSIRKNPPRAGSSELSSTDGASAGPFSAGVIDSSATSLPNSTKTTPPATPLIPTQKTTERHPSQKRKASRRKSRQERQAIQRYWNEFDDGDEAREDQVYAIYVNPDEHTAFPGAETVSKAFSSMYQSLGRTKRCIISWLPMQSRDHDLDDDVEGVHRPLLGVHSRDADYENDDSSDTGTPNSPVKSSRGGRSTRCPSSPDVRRTSLKSSRHSTKRHYVHPSHEITLFRTYVGCYAIAFILLTMSAILKATGRHKAKVQVDAGVIVGVIAALCSAIIGMSLMISREERLSWFHRALGGSTFLVVCIGSGWLLAVVGGSLS